MHKIYAKLLSLTLSLTLILSTTSLALAGLGVGVATGKIVIDKTLHSGTIYELPPFTVLNTGDEPAKYGVGISPLQDQQEHIPESAWFSYSPDTFDLEPGQAQIVRVTLALPIKGVQPGKYFTFLQAHPVVDREGGASIGIAAAAKLYFDVAPANILAAIYYRVLSFWQNHLPWSNVAAGAIGASLVLAFLKKNFSFTVAKKASKKTTDEKPEKDE